MKPLLLAAALLLWTAAPTRAAGRPEITVLAAASLAEVLPELAKVWPSSAAARAVFSFDASSRLTEEALRHAPADVLVVADSAWMDVAVKGSATLPGTRTRLAGNRLVVVVPRRPVVPLPRVEVPRDLAQAGVRRIALAGEIVPAGRYAQQALEREGVWPLIKDKVVRAGSVRGALRLAALGEADAALVYSTDAAVEPRVRAVYEVPDADHVPVSYEGAVLYQSIHQEAARSFLAFCASAAARPVWKAAGFSPPAPARAR